MDILPQDLEWVRSCDSTTFRDRNGVDWKEWTTDCRHCDINYFIGEHNISLKVE